MPAEDSQHCSLATVGDAHSSCSGTAETTRGFDTEPLSNLALDDDATSESSDSMPPLLQRQKGINHLDDRKLRHVRWGGEINVDEPAAPQEGIGLAASSSEVCGTSSAIEKWLQRIAADLTHMRALGCSAQECRSYCRKVMAHSGPFSNSEAEAAYRILIAAIDDSFAAE